MRWPAIERTGSLLLERFILCHVLYYITQGRIVRYS